MFTRTVLDTKHDIAEVMLSSLGVSSENVGQAFGRFDLAVPAIPGSPVYKQAHSKKIQTSREFLLYR